jgi:hypothetical protein
MLLVQNSLKACLQFFFSEGYDFLVSSVVSDVVDSSSMPSLYPPVAESKSGLFAFPSEALVSSRALIKPSSFYAEQ